MPTVFQIDIIQKSHIFFSMNVWFPLIFSSKLSFYLSACLILSLAEPTFSFVVCLMENNRESETLGGKL